MLFLVFFAFLDVFCTKKASNMQRNQFCSPSSKSVIFCLNDLSDINFVKFDICGSITHISST